MTIDYNKIKVIIHLDRIRHNYELILGIAGNATPVIKADAYGHGLVPVARTLAAAGANTFAVGTIEEAVKLRGMPFDGRIIALLGPFGEDEHEALIRGNIIPLVFSLKELERIDRLAGSLDAKVAVALKFDTGMARLGFRESDIPRILKRLPDLPNTRLEMVCSHLAVADEPESAGFVRQQAQTFARIVNGLRAAGYSFEASLANSAAAIAYPELRFEMVRPGISLYGGNPFIGTNWENLGKELQQAMEVTAPIVQVHDLKEGRSISYGLTFTAPQDMRVAVVAAGYADGYSRGMSNTGFMLVNGHRAPIVGRVCMQMTAIDVTGLSGVENGTRVTLLGGEDPNAITADDLASWWGTINYEVFCVLGLNRREYVGE